MSNIVNLRPYNGAAFATPDPLLEEIAFELGTRTLPFMLRQWQEWRQIHAVDADMLQFVLLDTLKAPRPSWAYFAAIVRRCIDEGCTTLDAYIQRQTQYHRRRKTDDQILSEIV